jgi:gamma-glutamyltranspeptidase/glutathione hydrolase
VLTIRPLKPCGADNRLHRDHRSRLYGVVLLCVLLPLHVHAAPLVEATRGMVVSVSPEASDAGLAILQRGGTAVDAAVTTALAMSVTFPEAGNIGGGGFMMVLPGPGLPPVCVEYRETAPAATNAQTFVNDVAQTGHRVVGVPGTVRGLAAAHSRYGKVPWRELVLPAVKLARDGFNIDPALASGLNSMLRTSTEFAEFVHVFRKPDGSDWRPGDRLVQPDLAQTLQTLADEGPEAFYQGRLAEQFVAEMRRGGGLITLEDLANYRPTFRAPIHGSYRGYAIYGPPPPSSGGTVVVSVLNVLEQFDLTKHDRYSAENLHLVVEATKRVYCDRARYLGDPAFTEIPTYLTSIDYAKQLAAQIKLGQATPSEQLAPELKISPEGESTTHFSVVDGNGMAVANTYTLQNSYGSRVVVRGGGYLLNNEMTDFNWRPGITERGGRIGTAANTVAPGKRMLSSQSPTLVLKDGKLVLVTGSPGGRTIPNTVLSVVLGVTSFGLDARQAVDAPRLHHQWLPDRLTFEGAEDAKYTAALDRLRTWGHDVSAKASRQGDAHSIMIVGDKIYGAADARRTVGKAAGF